VPRYDLPNAAPEPLRLVQQFVNTVDNEHGREWFPSPSALTAWCAEHGLPLDQPVSEAELRRALELRDGLRSLARSNNGFAVPPESIAIVNHALLAARIEPALDSSAALVVEPHTGGFDGVLGSMLAIVVRSMLDGSWTRLKACRNCSWLFYDYSSNRSATWCSMQICGNRRKTREYRKRRSGQFD
jgi:predicted RNA-binding Zn ribbon-like protein